MKQMNIRDFEITKEIYNRAKEIENIYKELHGLDCMTKKFKKLQNKVIELEDKFEREVSEEFLTLEIVNEYERREKNNVKNIKKSFEEIVFLKKLNVIPQWTTGMKTTSHSMWTKRFIDAGYRPTGWRFCDRYGDWWDEYQDGKEFIYAEQMIRYTEVYK